jgi:branched-chain amino acid aminotransferase
MSATVNIDGRIVSEQQASISVFDHGFLYGEGVYEVLRTYRKEPFLFEPHMTRLRQSAEQITLSVPWSDAEMRDRIAATIAASDIPDDAYVRILLTRGVGELVYDPAACPNPTTVIIVKPHVDPPAAVFDDGVTIALVPIVRNHPASLNPRIKSNNLLNNALAMQQAYKRQAFEALMRNHRGELCECAQSNFFVVSSGIVRTAPLDAGLLAGVTRAFVLELGRALGYRTREEALFEEDLASADEAFLTSTTREIVPVVRVDTQTIGAGVPGPITRALMAEFHKRTAAPTTPVSA